MGSQARSSSWRRSAGTAFFARLRSTVCAGLAEEREGALLWPLAAWRPEKRTDQIPYFARRARMSTRTRRWGWARLGGAALLWCGGALTAQAAVTPSQILGFPPRQQGLDISTPTAEQQGSCKVDLVKGGKGSGYVLRDPAGLIVRRFFDSNGDNKIDTWCYYKDGAEVYREIDTSFNGRPDQYRWLNSAGSKWGLDANEDGKIDSWKTISPQEVSQEIVAALATGNHARLQALLLTEAEIKALDLTDAEARRLQSSLAQVKSKFDET